MGAGDQGHEATADRVNCVQVTDGQWLEKTPYNRKSSFLSHCSETFASRTSGREFYWHREDVGSTCAERGWEAFGERRSSGWFYGRSARASDSLFAFRGRSIDVCVQWNIRVTPIIGHIYHLFFHQTESGRQSVHRRYCCSQLPQASIFSPRHRSQ